MLCYKTSLRLTVLALTSIVALCAQAVSAIEAKAPGPVSVQRGKDFQAPVKLTIKPGFHINTNMPGDKYLIPLRITWDNKLVESGKTEFPAGKKSTFPFSSTPVSVYEGNVELIQHFKVKADATPGLASVTGTLHYQACTDKECHPPTSTKVRLGLDLR